MDKKKEMAYEDSFFGIDVIDLLWRLLYQWKAIVLFAIILAVIATFTGLRHDRKQYFNDIEGLRKQREQNADELSREKYSAELGDRTAGILVELDETDQSVVYSLLRLESTLQNEKDYFNESIYLNLDPNHVKKLRLSYIITGLEGADKSYMDVLLREYQKCMISDKLVDRIKEIIAPDADREFIRQLITMEGSFNNFSPNGKDGVDSFYIYIALPTDFIQTEEIKNIFAEELENYCGELSRSIVKHKLKLYKTEETVSLDNTLLQQKNDWTLRIADITSRVQNAKDTLKDKQGKAYKLIKNKGTDDSALESEEIWKTLNNISEPSVDIKYALLGAVLAVLLYSAVYLFVVYRRGTGYSANTLEGMTGKKVLQRVNLTEGGSVGKGLFSSTFFERIRNRGEESQEQQTEAAVLEVLAICKYKGLTKISLIADKETLKEEIEDMKKRLTARSVDCEEFDYQNISVDDYLNMSAGLLLIRENRTNLKDIRRSIEKMSFYNIEGIGIIYYR